MIEGIWELLQTFTAESERAVFEKILQLGLDPNRGEISLEESYINLNAIVDLLKDAIEKEKLIQLPITIQRLILQHLNSIQSHQANILGNVDDVLNLVGAIEKLNTVIWQYGFYNMSDEVLGYQTKLNQLKQLELESKRLTKELKDGVQIKKSIENVLYEANSRYEEINALNTSSQVTFQNIQELEQQITQDKNNADNSTTIIQQHEGAVVQLLATATKNEAEILAMEGRVRDFFQEIAEHKESINASDELARTVVNDNSAKTKALIDELKALEEQIKTQIEKATGYSLFHSFQTRQSNIYKSKIFWASALAVVLALSAGLTIYLVNTVVGIDTAFFLKLSLSIPLIFAISFCTVQYSRERRLEEEYAFKSNISISLVPYQELVERLVSIDDAEARRQYSSFIIDAITKVFTSPTEEIFKDKSKGKGLINDAKALKNITELIDAVSKGIKGG